MNLLNRGAPRQPATPAAIDLYATDPWIRTGNRVLLSLSAGLALFGLVSISGAVIASGIVNVESNYKAVQHLDGGIVQKIMVRNGDLVKQGDIVLRLDDTAIRANFQAANARVNDLLVQQARFEAERDRRPLMTLPAEVLANADDPALKRLIATQHALFEARRQSHEGELAVLVQRRVQIEEELKATQQGLVARRKEAAINQREIAAVRPLYEKGYANQQRLLPIERDAARLEGDIGRMSGDIAKVRSSLAEAELKLKQSEKDLTQQVVDELRKVQAQLAEAVEQRTAIADKLSRVEVRAPQTGRINALAVHTAGAVIPPGGTIMQLIPEGERLIIDAQIQPQDVDKVRSGISAYVRFPAFDAKSTPRLEGSVLSVSPAQLADQQGRNYFLVQVALADGEIRKLPPGRALVPGMPAEVFIETGARTILSYFVKPMTDIIARTFRER